MACSKLDCSNPLYQSVVACCGTSSEKLYVDNVLLCGNSKGILVFVIFLAIQGFIFWVWVFMTEADQFSKVFGFLKKALCRKSAVSDSGSISKQDDIAVEDSDVIAEKAVAKRLANNSKTALVSENLVKWSVVEQSVQSNLFFQVR